MHILALGESLMRSYSFASATSHIADQGIIYSNHCALIPCKPASIQGRGDTEQVNCSTKPALLTYRPIFEDGE